MKKKMGATCHHIGFLVNLENPTLPSPFDQILAEIDSIQCVLRVFEVFFNFDDPPFQNEK